jgi:hypothetical protein
MPLKMRGAPPVPVARRQEKFAERSHHVYDGKALHFLEAAKAGMSVVTQA